MDDKATTAEICLGCSRLFFMPEDSFLASQQKKRRALEVRVSRLRKWRRVGYPPSEMPVTDIARGRIVNTGTRESRH